MTQTNEPLPPAPDPYTQDSEPLRWVGAIGTLVTAIVTALIVVGLPVDPQVATAFVAVIAAAAPLVTALIGRGRVYSPKSVARLLAAQGNNSTPPLP